MSFTPSGGSRQAEGYSKEVFGGTDATLLPLGITEVGATLQVPTNLSTSGGGNTLVELFAAMLVELRQMNALLASFREPLGAFPKLRETN
jgi:hypothetical protein